MDTLTIVGGIAVVAMVAFIVWKAKQPKKKLNEDSSHVPPLKRKGVKGGGGRR